MGNWDKQRTCMREERWGLLTLNPNLTLTLTLTRCPPLSLLAAGCMGNWDKQLTCMREERWDLRNFALGG